MTDSARLPGVRLWTGPVQFYQWFRQVDAAIGDGITATVNLSALEARVSALEGGGAGGVTSFRGRSGDVTPLFGDYSQWFQPKSDTLDALAAADLTSIAEGDTLVWDGAAFAPGAATSTQLIPVVTGEIPAVFVQLDDGSLVFAEYA